MEGRYTWSYGVRLIILAMRQALIINKQNARCYPIEIKGIQEIEKENFISSGMALFFDKDYELIAWASSYDDIAGIAKEIYSEDVYGYHIISDTKKPFSDKEVDNMYFAMEKDYFFIMITNRNENIQVEICLN